MSFLKGFIIGAISLFVLIVLIFFIAAFFVDDDDLDDENKEDELVNEDDEQEVGEYDYLDFEEDMFKMSKEILSRTEALEIQNKEIMEKLENIIWTSGNQGKNSDE